MNHQSSQSATCARRNTIFLPNVPAVNLCIKAGNVFQKAKPWSRPIVCRRHLSPETFVSQPAGDIPTLGRNIAQSTMNGSWTRHPITYLELTGSEGPEVLHAKLHTCSKPRHCCKTLTRKGWIKPTKLKDRVAELDCLNVCVLDWGKTSLTEVPSSKVVTPRMEIAF